MLSQPIPIGHERESASTQPPGTPTWPGSFVKEAPIFLLGTIGAALALFQRRNSFAIFAGIWAFALLAAYSILPYKTPWILLNMILPLCLVAGHAVQELWDARTKLFRGAAAQFMPAAMTGLALAIGFYQSVQLNFFHYDDSRYSYP
jgi:predicted membrane-bound mannosyltransferase